MALDLSDKTANGNTLTNNNGATEVTNDSPFTPDTSVAALALASSQYFSAADSASLSINGDKTIELWAKFSSTPASGDLMSLVEKFVDTGNQRSYGFQLINNSGTLQLRWVNSTDGTFQAANDVRVNWTPTTGTWYHLAVVQSGTSVLFYVDGSQQGATQTLNSGSTFDSTGILTIGARANPQQYIDGRIDEVRIWATARSSTDIANNRSLELTGSETNLNAYYPFNAIPSPSVVSTQAPKYFFFM